MIGSFLPLNEDVVIVNLASRQLLDADIGTINADGTKVQLYGRDATGQSQRQWRLASAGGDKYNIFCRASRRLLDADLQTIQNDGTKVQLYGTDIPAPPNRQWHLVEYADIHSTGVSDNAFGGYLIRNAQSGRLLDAATDTLGQDGTKVQLYGTDVGNMRNRVWLVIRLSDYKEDWTLAGRSNEPVVIVNVVSGRLLDADTGTINADGTKVQLYGRDATGQSQRQWRLASAGENRLYIICSASGRLLDADTQTIQSDGTKVQLYGTQMPAPLNRQWELVYAGNHRYYIVNAQSGRLLDAGTDMLAQDGTEVQLYGTHGSDMPNRQWRLIPLSEYERSKPAPYCFQDAPPHFDLLIIAPFEFSRQFQAFRTAKRNHGVESHLVLLTGTSATGYGGQFDVVLPELPLPPAFRSGVVNDFPGADDPERIKRAIEYAYRVHGAKYVMLAGDASLVPCRRVFLDEGEGGKWQGWDDGSYRPSDLYYASLYHHPGWVFDTWDANANNKYNETKWNSVNYNPDGVDGCPDVAVGRIPTHTAAELRSYLQKVIDYETRMSPGPKPFGFVADRNYTNNGTTVADQMCDEIAQAIPHGYASSVTRMLFNSSSADPLRTGWARADDGTLLQMAKSCWWIVYVGHGGSGGWDFSNAAFDSVRSLSNSPNFPIVFAAACETGQFVGIPPFGSYQDNLERFRWFYYHEEAQPAQQIDERDVNGNVLRYVQKPLAVPTPSPYDFKDSAYRAVPSAWLFNSGGGGIAYFGEVLVCPDNWGHDLAKDFVASLANSSLSPVHALGDVWLLAQQQYWNDNKSNSSDNFGPPRIYLGVMTFFGDPSLRIPSL